MRAVGLVLALWMLGGLSAQEQIDRTFLRRYNYGGMQGGLALTTTDDGGFIATGQHEGNGSAGGCDIYVYKVDACGNRIWFRLFGTGGSEGGRSIEATPDGGFIIGGHSSNGLLLKLDSEGMSEWYHQYPAVDWVLTRFPWRQVAMPPSAANPVGRWCSRSMKRGCWCGPGATRGFTRCH